MSSAPFGFGSFSGLRRSVIDPDTGLPTGVTAPAGELAHRSALLPAGVDDSGRIVPAIPGLLTGMGDALFGAATLPRDVYRGDVDINSDDGQRRAFDLSALMMTGGMPMTRPAGSLGTFGGRTAATADHAALSRAEGMASGGAGRDAIWSETGWFQGSDGKWRFEIPDDTAALSKRATKGLLSDGAVEGGTAGLLNHTDLYKAYPELRRTDAMMEVVPPGSSRRGGLFLGNDVGYRASGADLPEVRSIGLHELQHGVQSIEGFAGGGPVTAPGYRNLAGEVEARNVQARRDMTPAERQATPPWVTQDVPDAAQTMGCATDLAASRLQETLVSRAPPMYDPIPRPARPFEADYPVKDWPDGPPADASGRLTRDIDGRPLNPDARIVGRRTVGGADEALSPAELDAAAAGALGQEPLGLARGAIPRRGVGAYDRRVGLEGPERSIYVDRALGPAERDRVVAHEFGHAIEDITGDFVGAGRINAIPQDGLKREIGGIYNELNNASFRDALLRTGGDIPAALASAGKARGMSPQALGYTDREAPAEFMSEAIRAYMADPNAMKTMAPKTAARVREYVNGNPALSQHIQFNSGGAPAFLGTGLEPEPRPLSFGPLRKAPR